MAESKPNIIMRFFTGIDEKNRAERLLIAHVFLLTLVTFWQLAYTQTYITASHDLVKLTHGLTNTTWLEAKHSKVLGEVWPLSSIADGEKPAAGDALVKYLHYSCVPIWKTVQHEQTWLRLLLLVAAAFYGLYCLTYLWKVAFKKEQSDLSPMEKRIEVTIWTITQLAEVFFIVYGIVGFFNLYTNILTPITYNRAQMYTNSKHDMGVIAADHMVTNTAATQPKNDNVYVMPNNAHCFAMDQLLGGNLWGKHTPFIHDKSLNDSILMIIIFISVFVRYLLTSLHIFNFPDHLVKYGIMNREAAPAAATGYPGAPAGALYNVVAMR
tara:strand:+ start:10169 stop:11143 length:975 start_codon:yes stop_codon:yes gene_type:complete